METQKELPKEHAALQVSGCRDCLSLLFVLEDSGNNTACGVNRWRILKEEVERLRIIRDCEGEINWWSCTLPSRREVHGSSARVREALTLLPSGRRRPKIWEMETCPCLGSWTNPLLASLAFSGALTEQI